MSDPIRVSSVLKLLFPGSLDFVDQADLDRGTALHFAMECFVNDVMQGLVPTIRDERIIPVLDWMETQDIEFVSAEERLNHKYGYTMLPDLDLLWKGEPWFFDWKFSQAISTQNKMQLTAYSKIDGRKVAFVQCQRDGKVKVIKCKPDPQLWAAFLSGLNVLKFRQSHQPFQLTPEQIETIKRETLEILCKTEN